jgi:hypothetical protein
MPWRGPGFRCIQLSPHDIDTSLTLKVGLDPKQFYSIQRFMRLRHGVNVDRESHDTRVMKWLLVKNLSMDGSVSPHT